MSNDKLALLFAGLHVLAREAGHDDLIAYLEHPSQHSDVFESDIRQHLTHIADVVKFTDNHAVVTQPGGASRTYTKDELDRMVAASVQKAIADAQTSREATFTRSELDDAIAKSVAAALEKFKAQEAAKAKDGY